MPRYPMSTLLLLPMPMLVFVSENSTNSEREEHPNNQ